MQSRFLPVGGDPIAPRYGTHFTIAELQTYVGGYVELACFRTGRRQRAFLQRARQARGLRL